MLLSVRDQFVQAILEGLKYFTIRAFRKDGRIPKPGESIFMYSGSRWERGERKRIFDRGMEPMVRYIGKISITPDIGDIYEIKIDEVSPYDHYSIPLNSNVCFTAKTGEYAPRYYIIKDIQEFAAMDGFLSHADQLAFFEKLYGLPFSGLIIFWKLHPEYLRRRNAGQ